MGFNQLLIVSGAFEESIKTEPLTLSIGPGTYPKALFTLKLSVVTDFI